MPPIPIHTASPISVKTAARGLGGSERGQESEGEEGRVTTALASATTPTYPTSATTPTYPTSATTPTYPAARPEAPAYPAPTSTAASAYAPVQPSPTRTTQVPPYDGPPMPQPGAVPHPDNGYNMNENASDRRTSLPPPPRAGEKRSSVSYSPTTSITSPPTYPTQMPPQFSIPPPTSNYAPTYSTSTTTTAGPTIPVFVSPMPMPTSRRASATPTTPTTYTWAVPGDGSLGGGPGADPRRGSLEHPPGYMQNPRASDMTASQRAAQEQAEKEGGLGSVLAGVVPEGLGSGFIGGGASSGESGGVLGGSGGGGMSSGYGNGGGFGGTSSGVMGGEGAVGGAWDKAKSWLGGVAEIVGEVEGEVWRRVGGK